MGLATKSSKQDLHQGKWDSAPFLEQLVLSLAKSYTQLALTRLTTKQRALLLATSQALRYHPLFTYTALADYLSRKLRMPLSTVKFNLCVLRDTGLLTSQQNSKRRSTANLTPGGQLLALFLTKN